jgi:hypothetical protein
MKLVIARIVKVAYKWNRSTLYRLIDRSMVQKVLISHQQIKRRAEARGVRLSEMGKVIEGRSANSGKSRGGTDQAARRATHRSCLFRGTFLAIPD